MRYCREQDEPKRVVSLVCDFGAKYLSKVFNPVYAAQEGWGHERHGQVRDVVFSRFPEGEEVVVRPDDPLRTVFMRMRAADVSQLPVVDGDRIVGLVDESDMLGAVLEGSAPAFELPVKDVMVTRLETISGDAPIRGAIPLFRRDLVAVMDGSRFLGIAIVVHYAETVRRQRKRSSASRLPVARQLRLAQISRRRPKSPSFLIRQSRRSGKLRLSWTGGDHAARPNPEGRHRQF